MIMQHSDARIDGQDDRFYSQGFKAGKEAYTAHPYWNDAELGRQASNEALLYLMSAPKGAIRLMTGFEKGYKTQREK